MPDSTPPTPEAGERHQDAASLPGSPVMVDGARLGLRRQPPRPGEHGREIAREAGLDEAEIMRLFAEGVMAEPVSPPGPPG